MRFFLVRGAILVALIAGCGKQSPAPSPNVPVVVAPPAIEKNQPAEPAEPTPVEVQRQALEPAAGARSVAPAEAAAVKKITATIADSVELGPTLVVWLIDGTPSAQPMVKEISLAAMNFYESPAARSWSNDEAQPLLTAVASFDDKIHFRLEEPAADSAKAVEAFDKPGNSKSGREMPFTALKGAVEKYVHFRAKERREVLFVLVSDEAGDDGQVVEELLEPLRKQAIPVYCIGRPAPWGQVNPLAKDPKAAAPTNNDSVPAYGPESRESERVDIGSFVAKAGSGAAMELVDSGFGPFALERLCRATRGQFIALRPAVNANPKGAAAKTWPSGAELRFDEKVVARYAPDYVSQSDYDKLLNENKACAALHEAAKLPRLAMEGTPGTRFPKDVEAKMAQKMSAAQQFAARNLPPVDRLHDLLVKGEPERANLKSPRWQAEFDLAFGRTLAIKARLDGYNSMIAALKRGKTFQNADSKAWVLESADNFETESTIKKTADKAKLYLERVVAGHAGTPWATIAADELKTPLGWKWVEGK